MRRFIFILMIALLPLRSLVGEAMATEMTAMNLIATESTNTPATPIITHEIAMADTVFTNMSADCEMHTGVQDSDASVDHACTHCQACHAVGLTSLVHNLSTSTPVCALPHAGVKLFASADRQLSQKPPIL